MYKHVRNTTNDRIRDYVNDVPTYDEEILGHTVKFTPIHSLERQVIQSYKDEYGLLPRLNVVQR